MLNYKLIGSSIINYFFMLPFTVLLAMASLGAIQKIHFFFYFNFCLRDRGSGDIKYEEFI